eukprot:scaffold1747_cov251-Pinguiococcus_pyrenoidosus.AAC.8
MAHRGSIRRRKGAPLRSSRGAGGGEGLRHAIVEHDDPLHALQYLRMHGGGIDAGPRPLGRPGELLHPSTVRAEDLVVALGREVESLGLRLPRHPPRHVDLRGTAQTRYHYLIRARAGLEVAPSHGLEGRDELPLVAGRLAGGAERGEVGVVDPAVEGRPSAGDAVRENLGPEAPDRLGDVSIARGAG